MPPTKMTNRHVVFLLYLMPLVFALSACTKGPPQDRVSPQSHPVELSWDPPEVRSDNTSIDPEDLAGYRIYYGTSPELMDKVIEIKGGSNTHYVIENLPPRRYYFAITAYDRKGRESSLSEVVSKTVEPVRPGNSTN